MNAQHFLMHPDRLTREIARGYAQGAFLMDNHGNGVQWYGVENRAIVPLTEQDGLHIARRLRRELPKFEVRLNSAFSDVVQGCRGLLPGAPARSGEWISPEMVNIYHHLRQSGFAHSFEVWRGGELAGGVLGMVMGGAFIAESKFHRVPNASKVALIRLAQHLHEQGFVLLDAQIQNEHLQTLGVYEISGQAYEELLARALVLDVEL